jgi:hypothetical protein
MALAEGRVGPQAASDGVNQAMRLDRNGAQVVAFTGGRFAEDVIRGNVYHASLQAGAPLGTALNAAVSTLALYNPAGSGVNLVVMSATLAITTAPAGAAAVVYALFADPTAAKPSATTPAVVRCNKLGPTTGKGQAFTAATFPAAPVVWGVLTNLSATIGATSQPRDELAGLLVLPENTAVTIQNIGLACSGIVSLTWAEVPA